MVKTILLDLDDTILDFSRGEANALRRALKRMGLLATPALVARYHAINAAQWRLLELGRLTRDQVMVRRFELLFGELGVEGSGESVSALYESLLAHEHSLMPGALALLKRLAPRYDLYAASNGSADVQHSRLAAAGIAPYFRGIFISEEVGADKPSPLFFQRCFAAIPDFSKETALMVGDSLNSDMRGGIAAGIRTCWFCPAGIGQGASLREKLPDICPDYTITDLFQLPPLLERL
ncbi:MAG: YjjG family noncanonical pyrimidine nucleotidase [Oscillospiraceae bacterium]|nr:YjjG family noncanonical pyrimidine nucleotidase [Oscillospiraceae bacterium]